MMAGALGLIIDYCRLAIVNSDRRKK